MIEFGKHRGQMLGTLSPSYLRWVTTELDYGALLITCQGARVVPQAVRNLAPPLRLASLPAGWLESPSRAPSYLRV